MNKRIYLLKVLILIFISFDNYLLAQTKPTLTRETYTTVDHIYLDIDTSLTSKHIYIMGRIYQNNDLNKLIPLATVSIKGTNIATGSDSLGFYFLDITSIATTSKNYTISCSHFAHLTNEVVIKHKIIKTTKVDISLTRKQIK